MAFTHRTQTSNDLTSWRKEQNTKQTGSITGKDWTITDFLKDLPTCMKS
jgi:hypothetical protein